MRGWAALSVVVFHSTVESYGASVPYLRTSYLGLLNDGRFAVAIFFALSGFVLSRRFIATQDRDSLQRMAAGRYVRLALPVGIISTVGFVMAALDLFPTQMAGAITGSDWLAHGMTLTTAPDLVSFLKFCVFNVFTDHPPMSYNWFTWTMRYELCGSCMLFATLALFGNAAMVRRLALLAMYAVTTHLDPLYGLFFGGALLAEANVAWTALKHTHSSRSVIGNLAGLVLIGGTWATSTLARDHYQTATALALLAATLVSPWIQSVLRAGPSQWLGRISFPLYLVHGYVIFGPGARAIVELDRLGLSLGQISLIVVPSVVASSLVAGWLLVPVEHLSKRAAHYTGRILTGAAVLPAAVRSPLGSAASFIKFRQEDTEVPQAGT